MSYPNAEVAHLWFHERKPSAAGSHFFFEGDTIYSYGTHFPIARIHQHKKLGKVVIMTTNRYSITTSQHQNHVHSAIDYKACTVIEIPGLHLEYPSFQNFKKISREFATALNELIGVFCRARIRFERPKREIKKLIQDYAAYCAFSGFKPVKAFSRLQKAWEATNDKKDLRLAGAQFDQAQLEAARRKAVKFKKEEARRKKEILVACKVKCKEAMKKLPAWKKGGDFPHGIEYSSKAFLRLATRKHHDLAWLEIQTTKRSRISVLENWNKLALLSRLVRKVCAGEPVLIKGRNLELDHYPIHSLDKKDGLVIGCHKIPCSELMDIINQLGL